MTELTAHNRAKSTFRRLFTESLKMEQPDSFQVINELDDFLEKMESIPHLGPFSVTNVEFPDKKTICFRLGCELNLRSVNLRVSRPAFTRVEWSVTAGDDTDQFMGNAALIPENMILRIVMYLRPDICGTYEGTWERRQRHFWAAFDVLTSQVNTDPCILATGGAILAAIYHELYENKVEVLGFDVSNGELSCILVAAPFTQYRNGQNLVKIGTHGLSLRCMVVKPGEVVRITFRAAGGESRMTRTIDLPRAYERSQQMIQTAKAYLFDEEL